MKKHDTRLPAQARHAALPAEDRPTVATEAPPQVRYIKWFLVDGWKNPGVVLGVILLAALGWIAPTLGPKLLEVAPWFASRDLELGFLQFHKHGDVAIAAARLRNVSGNAIHLRRIAVADDVGQAGELPFTGTLYPGEELSIESGGTHPTHTFTFLENLAAADWNRLLECMRSDPCVFPLNRARNNNPAISTTPATATVYFRRGSSDHEQSESFSGSDGVGLGLVVWRAQDLRGRSRRSSDPDREARWLAAN